MTAIRRVYRAFHGLIILFRNTQNGGSEDHKRMMRACDENMETREELRGEIDDLKRRVRENQINSGVRTAVDAEE